MAFKEFSGAKSGNSTAVFIIIFDAGMLQPIKFIVTIALCSFWTTHCSGQGDIRDTTRLISQASVFGGYYLPGADFGEKYFAPAMIGAGFHIKTYKNWVFGVDGGYLFRDGIRNATDYLENMRTESGQIISQDGNYANIVAGLRGFSIQAHIGKIFNFFGPNPNSGLIVRAGGGFFQHKIHLEARTQEVPQLEDDKRPYYDQLTNGFSLNQFIGYQNLSNSKLTNFYIGVEFIEAFTQNRREYNIDLGGADDKQYIDLLIGIKVGWIVPIYKRKPQEFYFY